MAKLTPELREAVQVRVAAGASYADAAKWLKAEHQVSVSRQAIKKIVDKRRVDVADVSKAIARDHVAKTLPADLVAVDEKHAQSARLLDLAAQNALTNPSTSTFESYSKAAQVFLKFEELKRKTLGLDQPDQTFVGGLVDLCGLALAEEEEAAAKAAIDADADGDPRTH